MATLNFDRHSLAPLKTIKEVQFGLFSPEEVAGMSVAHIQYPETIVSKITWRLL
jgi:DNA-directed RNA polymerase II subunit RPB1